MNFSQELVNIQPTTALRIVVLIHALVYLTCLNSVLGDRCTAGYARTNVIGSRTSLVIVSVRSSIY